MIKKIERPVLLYAQHHSDYPRQLNKWFDQNIKPLNKLISEGLEVQKVDGYAWDTPDKFSDKTIGPITHKALLIGIQPIKKETPSELIDKALKELGVPDGFYPQPVANAVKILEDAKRALEGE